MADKAGHRPAQHRHPVVGRRQLFDHDAPLRFEALRQVSIGIQRDAVGPQLRDLSHGAGKGLRRLLGQAVDQVDIDRLEADAPRRSQQAAHLLEGLDAVHRLLHVGIEILHAEVQPVEAQRGQMLQALGRGGARVDLDRQLGARRELEVLAQQGHQLAELGIAQEGGRATPQVQLRHALAAAQHRHVQRHLLGQHVQILGGLVVVFGDDLVAGAVVADRFTERDVQVHRQRRPPPTEAPDALFSRAWVYSAGPKASTKRSAVG